MGDSTSVPKPTPRCDWPHVDVVVPAHNEGEYVERCLASLDALDYPPDNYTVLVVDNASRDDTAAKATRMGHNVIHVAAGNVGAVRNRGAERAHGEFIAFLDGDCVAKPDWLRNGVHALRHNPDVGAVGASCLAEDSATWLERAWASESGKASRVVETLTTAGLLVRREVFSELGGFSENLSAGEDYEFARRVRASGRRLLFDPSCAVFHLGWPKTLGAVFRRQVWHGTYQIEAAKSFWNKALLLVHVFVLCLLGLFFGLLFAPLGSAWQLLPMAGILAVPALAAVYRTRNISGIVGFGTKALALFPIFIFYYFGRSVGLVKNYLRLVRSM